MCTRFVYRGDDMEEKELTFTRDTIEKATVEYEMKENHVGYLKITEFDDVTYDQYVNAMDDLENQGMERLIIDLRSNPGGNVSTVCDILKTLLPKGMIVYTEDKNGEKTEYKNDEDHTFDKPLVVLVNGSPFALILPYFFYRITVLLRSLEPRPTEKVWYSN